MVQVTSPVESQKDNIDREVEFLLKEYESMRSESLTREASRVQLGSVTIILIGGIIAIVPFLFQGTSGLQLRIPLSYTIFILLIVSLLFSSLQWAYLLHDFEVGHIANYIRTLRTRACQLLNLEVDSAKVFSWDIYHTRKLYQTSGYAFFAVAMLNMSRYVIITIPALISLFFAGWLYGSHLALLNKDLFGWMIAALFLFDSFYFLVFFTTAYYCMGMYKGLTTVPNEDEASHPTKPAVPNKKLKRKDG